MKKILALTILSLFCLLKLQAQYTIGYTYDAAGNRVERVIKMVASQAAPNDEIPPKIEDKIGERKLEVFPNPTKGSITLKIIGGNENDLYTYSLYNGKGIKVKEGNRVGQGEYKLDLTNYPNGMYILVLMTGKEKLSYKIIKE